VSPKDERTTPTGSRFGRSAARLSSSAKIPPTNAMTATGTLIKKTDPHQKCCRSQPPRRGHAAAPMPPTPAQIPMARARRRPEKVDAMMARVAGMRRAAPNPMTVRAAIRGPVE
jgi:hypothetical protein